MDWTSHPEPKRKTDQYPGGHLPQDLILDRMMGSSEQPIRSDGKNALKESFWEARKGFKYTNQISCLRGPLRKAIIKLAEEVHKSDNINILPAQRVRMEKEALGRFFQLIQSYQKIVSEVKDGQTIWRLK
jgi:hypothetical protein